MATSQPSCMGHDWQACRGQALAATGDQAPPPLPSATQRLAAAAPAACAVSPSQPCAWPPHLWTADHSVYVLGQPCCHGDALQEQTGQATPYPLSGRCTLQLQDAHMSLDMYTVCWNTMLEYSRRQPAILPTAGCPARLALCAGGFLCNDIQGYGVLSL